MESKKSLPSLTEIEPAPAIVVCEGPKDIYFEHLKHAPTRRARHDAMLKDGSSHWACVSASTLKDTSNDIPIVYSEITKECMDIEGALE